VSDIFRSAYPLALRAARAYSARWRDVLRAGGLDREDLESSCISEVWRNIGRFDSSKSSFRTFVERIVASKTASFLRKCQAHKRAPSDIGLTRFSQLPIDILAIEVRVDFSLPLKHRRSLLTASSRYVVRLIAS
jgi:DNA-directed RNA polymerase specialized sigma24 family protein